MRGKFSAAKLSRAAAPKQNDWGGFKQAKVCLLAIGVSSQNPAKTVVLRRWLPIALFYTILRIKATESSLLTV